MYENMSFSLAKFLIGITQNTELKLCQKKPQKLIFSSLELYIFAITQKKDSAMKTYSKSEM